MLLDGHWKRAFSKASWIHRGWPLGWPLLDSPRPLGRLLLDGRAHALLLVDGRAHALLGAVQLEGRTLPVPAQAALRQRAESTTEPEEALSGGTCRYSIPGIRNYCDFLGFLDLY